MNIGQSKMLGRTRALPKSGCFEEELEKTEFVNGRMDENCPFPENEKTFDGISFYYKWNCPRKRALKFSTFLNNHEK
jgi:hypothetical protein